MATQQQAKRDAEYWDRKGKYLEAKLKRKGVDTSKGWHEFNQEMMKRIDAAAALGAEKRKAEVDKIYSEGAHEVQANFDFDTKKRRSYFTGKK